MTRTVIVVNRDGLHARPAGQLAKAAHSFEAQIAVVCRNERIDAKNMLEWMTLAAN